jgi:hypothetical protein
MIKENCLQNLGTIEEVANAKFKLITPPHGRYNQKLYTHAITKDSSSLFQIYLTQNSVETVVDSYINLNTNHNINNHSINNHNINN